MNEVRNIYIGIAFGKEHSQIAYYDRRMREAVCVPEHPGDTPSGFPTLIAKKQGGTSWLFGSDALALQGQPDALVIRDLLGMAKRDGSREIDGVAYTADALLSEFFSAALKLLGLADAAASIDTIMLTSEEINETMVIVLRRAFARLGFPKERLLFQDENESFYHFAFAQSPDFFAKDVALFSLYGDRLAFCTLHEDRATRPSLVSVRTEAPTMIDAEPHMRDLHFLAYAKEQLEKHPASGVLLLGDGFLPEEMKHSIQFLLQNRRKVFYGDNLFVQGACFAAYEKCERHALGGKIFVSKNMIRSNLGIEMTVKGERAYVPLIAAGTAWFEANRTVELLLEGRDRLHLTLRPMLGGEMKFIDFKLSELPKRPAKANRIRLQVSCASTTRCRLTAEDLGLGAFCPGTQRRWEKEIDLDGADAAFTGEPQPAAGYVLCSRQQAETALYLSDIAVPITNLEELCFFFYHYSALVDTDERKEELISFVENELQLPACAAQMEAAKRRGRSLLPFFTPAFRELGYLSRDEVNRFGAMLMAEETLPRSERLLRKAEALMKAERYAAAQRLLKESSGERGEAQQAQAESMQGFCALKLMHYDEALSLYDLAWQRERTRERLFDYLHALVLAKPEEKQAALASEKGISGEDLEAAQAQVAAARESAGRTLSGEEPQAFLAAETARYHAMQGA